VYRRFVDETFCRGDVWSRRRFVEETFLCAPYLHCLYAYSAVDFAVASGIDHFKKFNVKIIRHSNSYSVSFLLFH
jgi:hypothetical protein